jgi:hypothetical protein
LNLVDWWKSKERLHFANRVSSQNEYDRMLMELRREVAPFLQQLFSSDLWCCRHCHWPVHLVDTHTTMITDGTGNFVLCEHCWSCLRATRSFEKIRQYYQESRKRFNPKRESSVLDKALLKDLGEISFEY